MARRNWDDAGRPRGSFLISIYTMQLSWILLAAPAPDGSGSGGGAIQTLVMFGTMALIFFFMIYRPQKKRQKEREALLSAIEKGDKVVTTGGMHGTVAAIEDNTILIQVADNTKIRFERSAVTTIANKKA